VDHTDDFDSVADDTIENEVGVDDEVAQTWPDVVACRTASRMLGKFAAGLIQPVEQGVRGVWIVGRNETPDADKVRSRFSCAMDARHSVSGRVCGRRP